MDACNNSIAIDTQLLSLLIKAFPVGCGVAGESDTTDRPLTILCPPIDGTVNVLHSPLGDGLQVQDDPRSVAGDGVTPLLFCLDHHHVPHGHADIRVGHTRVSQRTTTNADGENKTNPIGKMALVIFGTHPDEMLNLETHG